MKVSTGLTLAAIGAILAFAVHAHVPYVNLNAVGWVLMLVGVGGMFAPRGTHRWIRQRLIMRNGKYGPALEQTNKRYSRHLMPGGVLVPDGSELPTEGTAVEEIVQE